MRTYLVRSILAVMILGALFAMLKLVWAATAPAPTYANTEATVVKVILKNGHGSAVHVGNGFFVSAAHVAKDTKTVELKSRDGKMRSADVLWINEAYDIALLRSKDTTMAAADLACSVAPEGEFITAYGNPLAVEFAAAYGRIAGAPRAFGPWKSVFVTDITTVMGQSGGPVFDAGGRLIGITVGVLAAPLGFSSSLVGYGFVVPSREVCSLLARDELA